MLASRLALLPPLFAALSTACSSPSVPSTIDPAHPDVTLEGSATSAALDAMLTVPAADDPARAAYFDNPEDLADLPGTPILTFSWHDGKTTALRLLPQPAREQPTFLGVLSELLGERAAHAGPLPTMTGPGYLLAFRTLDTNEALFRVFTSGNAYTPDAAAWAKLATGVWTTLRIQSASFDGDRLAAGGAPVNGQYLKFCIHAPPR